MQQGIGDRLSERRGLRQEFTDTAAQPHLQNIAEQEAPPGHRKDIQSEQEAVAGRQVNMEGSLGANRRADISNQADLARQDIKAQSLGQQIQSEEGIQSLQNEFTAMYNDMANTQFTQQLSGMGEEIDRYMAEKGRSISYDQLATKAQANSDRMMGRLLDGMGDVQGEKKKSNASVSFGSPYEEEA